MISGTGLALGRSDGEGRAVVHLTPEQRELLALDGDGRRARAPRPASDPAAPPSPWLIELPDPPLLAGRVVEVPGGLPIAEAWVYVPGPSARFTRSDRAGYFEMVAPRTRDERIKLVGAKDGYLSATAEVSASSPPLQLGLAPAAMVEGRVVDAAGHGVAGAQVRAAGEAFSTASLRGPVEAVTDRDGFFAMTQLPTGQSVDLEARRGRISSPRVKLANLAAGPQRGVELVLPQPERWTCRLVDGGGRPVPQAELIALPLRRPGQEGLGEPLFWEHASREGIALGRSDAEGKIVVDSLAAGAYLLGVRAKGFSPALFRSLRLGGEPSGLDAAGELEIELRPAALARGKVVDENGRGIADAGIRYSLIDPKAPGLFRVGAGALPVAMTDERGEFQFQEVEAGRRIYLLAHKKGYREAALDDVAVGESPLLLTLRRSGSLSGRILAGGAPRQGLLLRAMPLERFSASPPASGETRVTVKAVTEADGRFRIEGFGPGRYRLEVVPPPGFQPFGRDLEEIPGGSEQQLAIELEKAAVVSGRVLLASGVPVEGAVVFYARSEQDSGAAPPSRTDNLGQFRIETASPGPGLLRISSSAHGESTKKIDLQPGASEVEIVLEAGQLEIAAQVVGPGGEPLAGADVQILGDLIRQGFAGEDGRLRFGELRPGRYLVTILKEGWRFTPQHFELKASRSFVWRLEPRPATD